MQGFCLFTLNVWGGNNSRNLMSYLLFSLNEAGSKLVVKSASLFDSSLHSNVLNSPMNAGWCVLFETLFYLLQGWIIIITRVLWTSLNLKLIYATYIISLWFHFSFPMKSVWMYCQWILTHYVFWPKYLHTPLNIFLSNTIAHDSY